MTIGSKTFSVMESTPYGVINVDGSRSVSGQSKKGLLLTKNWSGADRPKTSPTYVTYQFTPVGWKKPLRRRIRTDRSDRLKDDDHNYSVAIVREFDSPGSFQAAVKETYYPFGPGDWKWVVQPGTYGTRATMYGDSFQFFNEWDANDQLGLLGKLREKIENSDFNAAVFLAEGEQALDLVTQNTLKIYRAFKNLKKRGPRAALRSLGLDAANVNEPRKWRATARNMANGWLQIQYGVIPLVKDVYGCMEFLSKSLSVPFTNTYRVSRVKFLSSRNLNPTISGSARGYTRKAIIARLTEVNVAKLVGLADPASVVWEKTPYSFVADWFIPIGSYLSARGLSNSLSGIFVTSTKTFTRKVWSGKQITSGPGVLVIDNTFPNSSSERIDFSRVVTTTLPIPVPTLKPLSKAASWMHCANAVSLLTSQFALSGWKKVRTPGL